MTRLIDADELKKKKKHSKEFAENVVSVSEIDWQPTAEAIPIDFIEKKIDEYREKEEKTKDVPLYGSFQWLKVNERLTLESLLLEWYAEPEEQNG